MSIYLDHAATTQLHPQVKQYIIELLDKFQNPSSLYQDSVYVKQIIEQSRQSVAKFINADAENIIFTSGGSASNTLGIKGYVQKHDCCILYSPIAHKSILKCVESCKNAIPLEVDSNGFIDLEKLDKLLNIIYYKPFVVIDYANSEIGTIQDVKRIIEVAHSYDGIVMLDCTGSISTIPLDVKELGVDLVSFSAHKLKALKGCGVLYKKPNIKLEPLVYGSQEGGLFAGTENVLGIVSLGKAVENYDYSTITSSNRDYVYNYILNNIPDSYLVGAPIGDNRLTHNLYMCFKGIQGESLMILFDINGIQCSTGSACTSGSLQPSTTLTAIGMNNDDMNSCIRLSFGGYETRKELDYVCKKLKECVEQLRCFS
ncbi:MAG: cysteine desulfurase [Alphaproteobacteria bacterium]|nr:cysteine desulfurase [Alphaproteobacteria bacterium]